MTTEKPSFSWYDTYHKLPRVAEKLIPKLHRLCGPRYIDLLLHRPLGVQTTVARESVAACLDGQLSLLKITVQSVHTPGTRRAPLKVYATDSAGETLELLFFNHGPWLGNLYRAGQEMIISGEVSCTLTGAQIIHPAHHSGTDVDKHAGTTAQYPLTAGVGQKMMQNIMRDLWQRWQQQPLTDWLSAGFLTEQQWPTLTDALKMLHHPTSPADITDDSPAVQRLAFDEFLAWQLALRDARLEVKNQTGLIHPPAGTLRQQFLQALPFQLTSDQQRAIDDIDQDMSDPTPMLRLVQGDVGSGKTVVAFASLLRAIEHGRQGALMAPTEVLAEQHAAAAEKWLSPLGITTASLTGKKTAAEKRKIKQQLAAGEIDLIIGTHALIQDTVSFANLGLAVVDEQHRFGVKQRLALSKDGAAPDVLVMTATPIPRTLTLTFYGDMDVTIIAEKPPGRTPINTKVLSGERLEDIAASLSRVIAKGEQVYWVCPLVETSEKSDLAAATLRAETLTERYGDAVALLHGKMKSKEKQLVLDQFRGGAFKILVATTVIEVGVDVPNATVMIIEHAERFGLAQLHQLRGRVGRGSLASSCILLYAPPLSQHGRARLEAMRGSDDGFYLAEQDLTLRGPGETLGTRQSGDFFTRIASLSAHKELMPLAKNYADQNMLSGADRAALLHTFGRHDAADNIKAG